MLVLAWLVLAAGALAHQLLDTTGGRRAGLRMRLDRTVG
jgi:hypothetical protein